jgi:hypothetical protein
MSRFSGPWSSTQTLRPAARTLREPGSYSTIVCDGCSGVTVGNPKPLVFGSTSIDASPSASDSRKTSLDPPSKPLPCQIGQMTASDLPSTLNPSTCIRSCAASTSSGRKLVCAASWSRRSMSVAFSKPCGAGCVPEYQRSAATMYGARSVSRL